MTLMKLKLGVINQLLADKFGVSPSVVSQILSTWMKFWADVLSPLIFWPSKTWSEIHSQNTPGDKI